MNEEPKQLKLPKSHELKVSWRCGGSNNADLLSLVTYYSADKQYYLWKVKKDGTLEKVKTKQTPDFSASELNCNH